MPTHANPNRRARLVSDAELAGYAEEDEVERRQAVAAGNGGRWRLGSDRRRPATRRRPGTRKSQASASGGKQWVFCYQAHTLCDMGTELSLAIVVTTGSRNDSPLLPKLIDRAQWTTLGSVRRFAQATGDTIPGVIMPGCWIWALRPCCTSGI